MANISSLITAPKIQSSKFWGLPLGKTDSETGNKFLGKLVQYLLINPYKGLMTVLPSEVTIFMRQTPEHPALGEGYARGSIGHTLCWPMPSIQIGDQYKHLKPPRIPYTEEYTKKEIKLQCSTAIETNQWMHHFINAEVHGRIINLIANHTKSAINNTINQLFNLFWLSVGGYKLVFGNSALNFFYKASTGADGTAEGNLKKYQEELEPHFKSFQEEAQKIKNINYYSPETYAFWLNKGDNPVQAKEYKRPENVNSIKTYVEKVCLDSTKKTITTRSHTLFAMLSLIRRTISDLTYPVPTYENDINYVPSTVMQANTELFATRCERSDLVVVLSHWDYDELKSGVSISGQTGIQSDNLDAATAGVYKTFFIRGLPPGFIFIGDQAFFNLIVVLDHSGTIFHWREEETQTYTNYYLNYGVFTQNIAAKVWLPAEKFHPGGDFLHWASPHMK